MSFELPSRQELDSISQSSGEWWNGRVADLHRWGQDLDQIFGGRPETPITNPGPIDSLAQEIAVIRTDVAFDAAMDRLTTDFRADLASIEAKLPVPEEAPALVSRAVDPSQIADDSEASCGDPEFQGIDPSPASSVVVSAPPDGRLASAVRLTRQALSAWASLLPMPAEENQAEAR